MTTYESMGECFEATGVSKSTLKAAKAKSCPGFRGHRIDWDLAGPWIEKNKDNLDKWVGVSLEELRKIKLQEDIENVKLQNQKLRKLYLDPTEVSNFLISMSVAQSAILKKMPKELAPRCAGKSVGEIEQMIEAGTIEVFQMFKVSMEAFMTQKD
jgi:hypothetical protein